MEKKIRVVLADDHPVVRAGIRAMLTAESDIEVVGEAMDGDEVRQQCAERHPDVLLLDLNMPGPPATETVAYLQECCAELKILVLTAYDDDIYVRGVVAAGAMGYILKEEAPETVIRAIRTVLGGDTWYSQRIVKKLAQMQSAESDAKTEASLSAREIELLELLAEGWDNAHIAERLHLAEQTVRNRVSRVYSKIGAKSRAEAIIWAREKKLS